MRRILAQKCPNCFEALLTLLPTAVGNPWLTFKCPPPCFHPTGDIAIPNLNFVSNGSSSPSDYKGEVSDLQLALRSIAESGVGAGRLVAVIGGQLTFAPSYNLQRIFEHSFIRGKDTLGYSILTAPEAAILGTEVSSWRVRVCD